MDQKKYTVAKIGSRIEEFLVPLLKRACLRLSFDVLEPEADPSDFENPDVVISFSGADVDLLLSNKAELLLALEHLTTEVLRVPPHEHSLVMFDANDYRRLRIEELRLSALAAAEKVKLSNQPFRFNPMNSRERRILHLALRNEPEIRSESSGAGPHRGVVVYPAGMPSLPEAPAFPSRRRGRR